MSKPMEFVFVVPAEKLKLMGYVREEGVRIPLRSVPQGMISFADPDNRYLCKHFVRCCDEHGFFAERAYVEDRPEFQQIIPYTVVRSKAGVLLMTRLATGGEPRLHGKLSVGAGGHINPIDAENCRESFVQILRNATERELHKEEITATGERSLKLFGLLNDNSDRVGEVHLGLVQVLTVTGEVSIQETEVLSGENASLSRLKHLRAEGANFEGWSGLVVDKISKVLAADLDPL